MLGLNRRSVIFRELAFHLKQSGANYHLDNTSTYLLFFFRSTFTALVFCYVKCASGNFQILKGVTSKLFLCRTAPSEASYGDACRQILKRDQPCRRSSMNYQELCKIGSVSFAFYRMAWQSIKMSITESQVELFILTRLFTKIFLEKNIKGISWKICVFVKSVLLSAKCVYFTPKRKWGLYKV